jgi:hypothetical protein
MLKPSSERGLVFAMQHAACQVAVSLGTSEGELGARRPGGSPSGLNYKQCKNNIIQRRPRKRYTRSIAKMNGPERSLDKLGSRGSRPRLVRDEDARIPAGVDEALSRGPVGCAGLGRSAVGVGIEIGVQLGNR